MSYATLDRVINKLRTARGEKVRLDVRPVSIELLDSNQDYANHLGVRIDDVFVESDFMGTIQVKVVFSDAVNYSVQRTYVGGRDFRPMLVGTGLISSLFTDPSGEFTFLAGFVIGTPNLGDQITFDFNVDFSEPMILEKIDYSDVWIDTFLNSVGVSSSEVSSSVLEMAGTYISAYMIWNDAFHDRNCEKDCKSCADRWKKEAEDLLKNAVKGIIADSGMPYIISFPSLVTAIGFSDEGCGMKELTGDIDKLLEPGDLQSIIE